MSRLIPTPIVDKNGKPTTVHKRPVSAPSASKLAGVAPSLGGGETKPSTEHSFRPSLVQTKATNHGYQVFASKIDPGLYPLLLHGDRTAALNITASDVDLYQAMGAIKDTTNALACFEANDGVPTPEFLEENGLNHLANDDPARAAMIQEALERRIPAYDFSVFDRKYSDYSDMPAYLDAAHAYSMATLRKIRDFVDEVRRGEILLSDAMAIGVKAVGSIKRAAGDKTVIRMLKALKQGNTNYTTDDLKVIFSNKNNTSANALTALELMRSYGGEFVANLKDLDQARNIKYLCDDDGVKDQSAAIKYADDFRKERFRNHKQVYELFKAGVDLDFALQHSRKVDEYSVQTVIALHEGISKPVAGGWL